MSAVAGAIWLYPWDLLDEGADIVLRRVRDDGGLSTIHLAVCYHAGLFILPHNPHRKVYFPLDGAVYYRPSATSHAGRLLQPLVHPMTAEADPLRVALEAGARLGVGVAAWIVPTHNTRLGMEHNQCVQANAFGNLHYPSLCPAHPEVRAYARTVLTDVARYNPAAIIVESLEYLPVEHGYHHEFMGIALTPSASILLGLCFCQHCRRRAAGDGVDAEAVRRATVDLLEAFFDGRGPAMRPDLDSVMLEELAGGQMAGFLKMREGVVTSLFTELATEARRSWFGTLARVDFAPLRLGGVNGHRLRSGADPVSLCAQVDRHDPTLYAADPTVIEEMLRAYRAAVPQATALMPALRAVRPQIETKEALIAAVCACRNGGASQVSFYNYGFMRLETLGWIREALEVS